MAILDHGFDLDLRPMRYPDFFERYKQSVANNWRVEEIDFTRDIEHLRTKMSKGEVHVASRLATFFATGDSLVANNAAIVLYKHVNAPEARMYLGRQLFEESLHIQFYLTLIDSYVPDAAERAAMFQAVRNVPSIAGKAQFCTTWMDAMASIDKLSSDQLKRTFLLNLLTFASAVEGLFFYAAFAYVFFLRSRGLLPGLAQGTNWVFRDETAHMQNAFAIVDIARREYPHLFDAFFWEQYESMLEEAVAKESVFAEDILSGGVAGLSIKDMNTYLKHVADQRLEVMGQRPKYGVKNPFDFLNHQDVPDMPNFFERRPTAYGVGTTGQFATDADF
jgi:ribonucleoside-diphosphate reductase beta chain